MKFVTTTSYQLGKCFIFNRPPTSCETMFTRTGSDLSVSLIHVRLKFNLQVVYFLEEKKEERSGSKKSFDQN